MVGGGLAGLVAQLKLLMRQTCHCGGPGGEQSLGGEAFWSFCGLFLVDIPEQRRPGIKDTHYLALQDWMGIAGFDRAEDVAEESGRG